MWAQLSAFLGIVGIIGMSFLSWVTGKHKEQVQFEKYESDKRARLLDEMIRERQMGYRPRPLPVNPNRLEVTEEAMSDETLTFLNDNMQLAGSPVRYVRPNNSQPPPGGGSASRPRAAGIITDGSDTKGHYWSDGTVRDWPEADFIIVPDGYIGQPEPDYQEGIPF
jgi:hypothetical protein